MRSTYADCLFGDKAKICCAEDVAAALCDRIEYFAAHGCLCADHGLDYCMYVRDDEAAARAFQKAMAGEAVSGAEADALQDDAHHCLRRILREEELGDADSFRLPARQQPAAVCRIGTGYGFDAVNSRSGVENVAPLLNAFAEISGLRG